VAGDPRFLTNHSFSERKCSQPIANLSNLDVWVPPSPRTEQVELVIERLAGAALAWQEVEPYGLSVTLCKKPGQRITGTLK